MWRGRGGDKKPQGLNESRKFKARGYYPSTSQKNTKRKKLSNAKNSQKLIQFKVRLFLIDYENLLKKNFKQK